MYTIYSDTYGPEEDSQADNRQHTATNRVVAFETFRQQTIRVQQAVRSGSAEAGYVSMYHDGQPIISEIT